MARASTYTLLTLDRFAKQFGINPIHFCGATTASLDEEVLKGSGGCGDIYYQYDWQHADRVSREHIARGIAVAEADIATIVGWWPAPVWMEEESHAYNRSFPREYYGAGRDVKGSLKSVQANYGKYIAAGRRSLIEVGQASIISVAPALPSLVYSDEDGDDFIEKATITLEIPEDVPESPSACNFKVFFVDKTQPTWEIRHPNSAEIVGENIVLTFNSWLFIKPELQNAYPTGSGKPQAIDISITDGSVDADDPFVSSVDVYYEYTDYTQPSAEFVWENSSYSCTLCGGVGCEACETTTQDGCTRAKNRHTGILVPVPASYNEGWQKETFTRAIEPDTVNIWYYSGEQSQNYIKGYTCDPLSNFWADVISVLAASRFKRNLCDCPSIKNTIRHWQTDLGKLETEVSYYQREIITNCPFGTLRGEVYAWSKIKHFVRQKQIGAAVI